MISGASCAAEFRKEIRAVLEGAEQFELLSINPDRRAPKASDNFHGWNVLGRTTVKDANIRKKLVAAFRKGVEENDGVVAACFNPRHGIRATFEGKSVDLVICFECFQTEVYAGGFSSERKLLNTNSPEPAFDGVLKAASVPLARDLEKSLKRKN